MFISFNFELTIPKKYYGPDDERNRGKAAGYCPDCIRQSEANARIRQ